MLQVMQILATTLVAIAMAPAVAHALEFPGKMRLNREDYIAVQGIYYPGFTVAGIAEAAGLLAVIVLLFLTPRETTAFWLTLVGMFGILGMQIVYWTLIHPINQFWLQSANASLGNTGGSFFAFAPAGRTEGGHADWTHLRDRWEYSHIARAGLVFVSFVSLLLAIVVEN